MTLPRGLWLGDRDSNPDSTVQSRMSCHWTIPQSHQARSLRLRHFAGEITLPDGRSQPPGALNRHSYLRRLRPVVDRPVLLDFVDDLALVFEPPEALVFVDLVDRLVFDFVVFVPALVVVFFFAVAALLRVLPVFWVVVFLVPDDLAVLAGVVFLVPDDLVVVDFVLAAALGFVGGFGSCVGLAIGTLSGSGVFRIGAVVGNSMPSSLASSLRFFFSLW